MIVRTWQGATREADADAYLHYLKETGLREYRATPGNLGVLALRRVGDGRAVSCCSPSGSQRRRFAASPAKTSAGRCFTRKTRAS